MVQFDKDVDRQSVQNNLLELLQTKANDKTVSVAVINIDNPSKLRISTNYKINDNSEGIENEISDLLYQVSRMS